MQPSLSPRRLCLFNTTTGAPLRELNFLTSILAIRMNRKRSQIHTFMHSILAYIFDHYEQSYPTLFLSNADSLSFYKTKHMYMK
jgi:hypothetical protein